MTTDGPAALRLMLDKLIPIELNAEWDKADKLVSVWQAERQAYQSAIEEADRLRFAAEAQRDAARAEAARLRELIKDAADGAGYAVTFGNMLVKGETIDNCGDPDAVSYLLGEAKAIEDKLRAALRESNDGN